MLLGGSMDVTSQWFVPRMTWWLRFFNKTSCSLAWMVMLCLNNFTYRNGRLLYSYVYQHKRVALPSNSRIIHTPVAIDHSPFVHSCWHVSVSLQLDPICTIISQFAGTSDAYDCLGQLFSAYIAGWDEYKKAKVYAIIRSSVRLVAVSCYIYLCVSDTVCVGWRPHPTKQLHFPIWNIIFLDWEEFPPPRPYEISESSVRLPPLYKAVIVVWGLLPNPESCVRLPPLYKAVSVVCCVRHILPNPESCVRIPLLYEAVSVVWGISYQTLSLLWGSLPRVRISMKAWVLCEASLTCMKPWVLCEAPSPVNVVWGISYQTLSLSWGFLPCTKPWVLCEAYLTKPWVFCEAPSPVRSRECCVRHLLPNPESFVRLPPLWVLCEAYLTKPWVFCEASSPVSVVWGISYQTPNLLWGFLTCMKPWVLCEAPSPVRSRECCVRHILPPYETLSLVWGSLTCECCVRHILPSPQSSVRLPSPVWNLVLCFICVPFRSCCTSSLYMYLDVRVNRCFCFTWVLIGFTTHP